MVKIVIYNMLKISLLKITCFCSSSIVCYGFRARLRCMIIIFDIRKYRVGTKGRITAVIIVKGRNVMRVDPAIYNTIIILHTHNI